MSDGRQISRTDFTRILAGMGASVCALGLSGCSTVGSVVNTFLVPSRADYEEETVTATLASPTISEDGVLTAGLDTSDAPQAMVDSDGTVTGYDVDVALAIAKRLGLSVKVVDAVAAANALEEDGADIFVGSSASNVSSSLSATGVYLEDASAIFTDTAVTSLSSVSVTSMETAVVAVQDGSASQDALTKAGIAATQQTYSNVNECIEALVAGEVDFVACDATAGAYLARLYEGIEFVGTISSVSTYCITMLGTNDELAEAVTEALEDIEADGTLDAIHTTWYGSLPTSLSGSVVSGVSISSSEDEDESATSGDSEVEITGDINSID